MQTFILVLLVLSVFWLAGISVLLWRLLHHYNSLTMGVQKKNLTMVLNGVMKQNEDLKLDIEMLRKKCATIEKDALLHIQKVGLIRFNPFKDTGGNQSFILALVDGNDTGILISGLYSRSGTRWYAKRVDHGKAVENELSDEEKKAISVAKESHIAYAK